MYQCASAVDNLAAFYFNNITMGEAPTSPAAINLARHIVDCPSLFPEVSCSILYYKGHVHLCLLKRKERGAVDVRSREGQY